jgi:phenylalanyl-tRNA synthetase beta chain
MKISLAWLKDYVVLPESTDALVEALTSGGTEVVGRVELGHVPDKVVVAQILSSEQHPNADRLSVCQVDDGSGHPRQIVCGAKNFKVGDKVSLALPGAVLGPDFKIKSGKLRGVVSDGMMCSAKELALAEDAEGLLILPPDTPVGKLVKDLFPPDTVLELEVTPNRPDLLGYRGVAQEVAALTQVERTLDSLPQVANKEAGDFVKLLDAGCPYYTASVIRGVQVAPSPRWMADRLTAAGLRPINNIVDVTNYVMLETGQPLHAFDLAKVTGSITVRSAREGEELTVLDGAKRKLRSRDMVIADDEKALAVAGVMGGAESGVTGSTTDIMLESAWFEPSRVRRSSRELGLSSDSSYRFERRVDPSAVLPSSARAIELILQISGGIADPVVLVAGSAPIVPVDVVLDNDRCRALLGLDVSDNEITAILVRLGLKHKGAGQWSIPSHRPDLAREVDLIEEVVRVAGIDRVPSKLKAFPAVTTSADRRHDRAEVLRQRLRSHGFSEARTAHFLSPESLHRAGVTDSQAVLVRNPVGADQALLRPVLMAGLLEAMARNLRHGVAGVRLFELGRVFSSAGSEEKTSLALIATGEKKPASWQDDAAATDLFDLKGVIEGALGSVACKPDESLGLGLRIEGQGVTGYLRRLPQTLADAHEAKSPVYCAEMIVDGWLEKSSPAIRVKPLPKFPGAERDLTFVLSRVVPFMQLEQALYGARAPHLQSVRLKDVFIDPAGVKLTAEQRALTVTLTFRDEARTLTSSEVDRAVETLRDHAKAELGAVVRE